MAKLRSQSTLRRIAERDATHLMFENLLLMGSSICWDGCSSTDRTQCTLILSDASRLEESLKSMARLQDQECLSLLNRRAERTSPSTSDLVLGRLHACRSSAFGVRCQAIWITRTSGLLRRLRGQDFSSVYQSLIE